MQKLVILLFIGITATKFQAHTDTLKVMGFNILHGGNYQERF